MNQEFSFSLKIITSVIFLLTTNVFSEDSMRCEGSLISPGEVYSKVINKCGTPAESVDYISISKIHQRYILDTSTQRRILFDKFVLTTSGEIPASSNPDKGPDDDIDDEEIQKELARLTKKNGDKNFKIGKFNVQRNIYNYELAEVDNFRYVYWETSIENNNMRKLFYNFGPTKFMRVLTFKNGILISIESKEYGY